MKEKIEFIKSNLALIILVPTMLGGIWQLLELLNISPSFIRFFSVSQLIPDGLLILFILLIIYTFGKLALNWSLKKVENGYSIFSKIVVSILCLYYLVVFFLIIFNKGTVGVVTISLACFCFIVVAVYMFSFIKKSKIEKFINKESFVKEILYLIFLFSFVFFLFSTFKVFHESFLLPKNWRNIKELECRISKDKNIDSFRLLYFNDKYFFVELTLLNDVKEIETIKFETITENCR
jgi:hypothetical protein|tara:strand:+ start:82 stop:789 length:708 start_codon:yes stop_codon:yes gene_type:complete